MVLVSYNKQAEGTYTTPILLKGESTILEPCNMRVFFSKTFRKTTALVTFRGNCAKYLSQSVTL